MIRLFYDFERNKWHQKSTYQTLCWGKERKTLSPPPTNSFTPIITINSSKKAIRPLVGILAGENPDYHFSGNAAIFTAIQDEITKKGGLSFVFTASSINKSFIKGYVYNEITRKWTGYHFPYPNIVYNRIPSREEENSDQTISVLNFLDRKGIPYFNKSFLNKADMYHLLCKNDGLRKFLPHTEILTQRNLITFLQRHTSVYCKPSTGSKGRGIFKLDALPNGYKYTDHINKHFFNTDEELLSYIEANHKETYLIQQGVSLCTYTNYRYDFRVLIQRPFNIWQVTGIGIRATHKDHLTTHVPRGGRIFPFNKVANVDDEKSLKEIAYLTATTLEDDGFFAEFSMDIGKDTNGNFWLFEVNAKPMRFDEPSIHQLSISSLISAFRTFSAY